MRMDQSAPKGGLADEELVLLVKKGDKDAFDLLSGRYHSTLKSRAGRYAGIAGVEEDDFLQEGLLALYRAARGYDPGGQAQFRTYAITCINNSMSAAIKLHMKQQNRKSTFSIDQLDQAQTGGIPMDQILLDRESSDQLADRIKTGLSDFERQVLGYYLSGLTYQQISQVLGTSAKAVDNALQRVRRKLRLHT